MPLEDHRRYIMTLNRLPNVAIMILLIPVNWELSLVIYFRWTQNAFSVSTIYRHSDVAGIRNSWPEKKKISLSCMIKSIIWRFLVSTRRYCPSPFAIFRSQQKWIDIFKPHLPKVFIRENIVKHTAILFANEIIYIYMSIGLHFYTFFQVQEIRSILAMFSIIPRLLLVPVYFVGHSLRWITLYLTSYYWSNIRGGHKSYKSDSNLRSAKKCIEDKCGCETCSFDTPLSCIVNWNNIRLFKYNLPPDEISQYPAAFWRW